MPEAAEFLSGFGLTYGAEFDGYTLVNVTSTHQSIKRYREYKYDITLIFTNNGSGTYENLFQAVMATTTQEHIIYGIRNPYRCIIDIPVQGDITGDNNEVTFHLTGHSYRA